MAGYVRQSAADIQAGLIVKSAIFNAEFDQLQSAFSTSGHTHDGTAGNGPKLDISNSTVGILDASRTNIPVADFVKGPAVSVDGRVAIFSGVTGKLINSSTDTLATLKNRANHTGSQAISTITGLRADLDSRTLDSTLSLVAKSGSYNDLSDKPVLGSAASQNTSAFATAAQGTKADTAVQTVNGKTGPTVSLTHTDVGAVSSTKEAEITANTTARHTHSNKTILDATTASYLAAEKTKLTGIEAGAQVNTVTSVAGKTGAVTLTSSDVGLGNVPNKTEAQMVATGAIADALGEKVSFTAQILSGAEAGQVRANIGAGILAGFRNKIINGDFVVWQRGQGPHTNFGYTADRWACYKNAGAEAASVDRQLFVIGHVEVPGSPAGYLRANVTNGGPAANGFISIGQQIEEVRTLSGQKATLTFYARANAPREVAIELSQVFGSGGSPRLNILVGKAQLTTTWKKYSYVIDVPSLAGKTVGSNACVGIAFVLSAGTDFSSRFDNLGIQTGTFDFSRVSLVEGDASAEADPFSPRHAQQELSLCQRYFSRIEGNNQWIAGLTAPAAGAKAFFALNTPVAMRVTPTVSAVGQGSYFGGGVWTSTTVDVSAVVGTTVFATIGVPTEASPAGAPGWLVRLASGGGTHAYITLDAEL